MHAIESVESEMIVLCSSDRFVHPLCIGAGVWSLNL